LERRILTAIRDPIRNRPADLFSDRNTVSDSDCFEARKLAGTCIDPRAGRIRLGEFTEQATAGWVNRRESTKAHDESYLRSLVLPAFTDMPIGAISVFDVQEWISDLDVDGYAPATIRKAYQLLGRILNDAVNGGLIARSPCRDVTLLIAQGAHPAVIAARLGHTSVKTVLDDYGQLYEGLDRDARRHPRASVGAL